MAEARRMLLVDDDDVFRQRLARAMRERGWNVVEAASAADAQTALRMAAPTHAVIDLRLPDGSGLDLVRTAAAAPTPPRVVVLTGYGSIATALEAVKLGAAHYLTKPAMVDDILAGLDGTAPPPSFAPAEEDVPSLARVEWEHINRVMVDCGGNISEAARRLGMHRRSLQRKLAKRPTGR